MTLEHSLSHFPQAQRVPALEHSLFSKGTSQTESIGNLVDYYLMTCKVEGKSPATLLAYGYPLREFARTATAFNPLQIRQFQLALQNRGICAETCSRYYRVLHSFSSFLLREGIITDNPMANMKPPKIPKTIHKPLTSLHIKNILSLCDNSFLGIRNKAIFLMFLDTGLRLDELSHINRAQVDIKQGTISIMGKGAKERRVRMGKVTHMALMRWWLLSQEYELPCLWLTEEKTQLHRDGVQIMIRRLFRRAGVTGVKIGPHTVRHTFAINSFRNGAREFDVQVILGHSTLTMTRAYMSDIGSDDAMKAHVQFSPVDNLE